MVSKSKIEYVETSRKMVIEFVGMARKAVASIENLEQVEGYVISLQNALSMALREMAAHPCRTCSREHAETVCITLDFCVFPMLRAAFGGGRTVLEVRDKTLEIIDEFFKDTMERFDGILAGELHSTRPDDLSSRLAAALRGENSDVRVVVASGEDLVRILTGGLTQEDDDVEEDTHHLH